MCQESPQLAASATSRADIARLHEFEHWPARWVWPLLAVGFSLQGLAIGLPAHYWPLLIVICPAIGTIMFIFTLAFHDASHGRFHPVHWMNELYGHFAGTVGFTPLHVYRYAHARHHAQLAHQGDPELWPYNSLNVPRALRVLAAFVEIVFGFFYTPVLFLRSVLVGNPTPRERKLIIRGYVLCIVAWSAAMAVVYEFNLWQPFIVATVVPLVISGTLQTLNKFEQHLGLHGHSVIGLTRTVVDRNRATELISAAMLYNDYHGTHHRYARIPYYHLPQATPFALATANEHCPVYPNIGRAILDMLACLADPKAGPQWNVVKETADISDSSGAWTVPIAQPVYTGEYHSGDDPTDTHHPPQQKCG
jgi:fatty acid desaturase